MLIAFGAVLVAFSRGFRLRLGLSFGMNRGRFFSGQRHPVLVGDLVVVRVDFVERQEAVAIAAILDKGCLQ